MSKFHRAYDKGYIDGLTAYAHWKSGTQFVGTTETTLEKAKKQRKTTWNYDTKFIENISKEKEDKC